MTTTESRKFEMHDPVRILRDFQTSKGLVHKGSIGMVTNTYYDWQEPKVRVIVYGKAIEIVVPPESLEYHQTP